MEGGEYMKKRLFLILLLVTLTSILISCGSMNKYSNDQESNYDEPEQAKGVGNEVALYDSDDYTSESEREEVPNGNEASSPVDFTRNMIIHTASIDIIVKDLNLAQTEIKEKINEYDGYIVDSNISRKGDQYLSGSITARVPSEYFEAFLTATEEIAAEVVEQITKGEDVTAEYVDLESRLKSKKVVEERLLSFMKEAEKTEDLLIISQDLARVQEEIDVVQGRMKYLKNQSSFSTIEIYLNENKIIIPEIDSKELNTWEKTKQQFFTSVNSLLSIGSGFIIFFVGNIPVILILAAIGFGIFYIIRRKMKRN